MFYSFDKFFKSYQWANFLKLYYKDVFFDQYKGEKNFFYKYFYINIFYII